MKFLACFFVIVISISSVLPSSGEAEVDPSNSDYIEGDLRCPIVDTQNGRCVVESKYCPIGYKFLEDQQICARATESFPQRGCDDSFTLDTSGEHCIKEERRYGCRKKYLPSGVICGRVYRWMPLCGVTASGSCKPRRIKMKTSTSNCRYIGYTRSADGEWCEFQEGSSEKLCFTNDGFDIETDQCISNKQIATVQCRRDEQKIDNECIRRITRPARWMCEKQSENRSLGEFENPAKPIVVCFEGTMSGASCKPTRNVPSVLTCPLNFSPDSITGKCKADVVTTTDLP